MEMQRTWGIGIVVLLSAAAAGGMEQQWSVTAIARKEGLTWQEAVGVILLAEVLDVDVTLILTTRREAKQPVFAIAPAIVIGSVTGRSPSSILAEKSKGQGWGVIAHRLGLHPGMFNKHRVWLEKASDDEFGLAVWGLVLTKAFGIGQDQITSWQKMALSVPDMMALAQAAQGSKTPPDKVLDLWKKEKDWDKVRAKLGVSADWLPPVRKGDKAAGRPDHPGVGKEKGRGRGHGRN